MTFFDQKYLIPKDICSKQYNTLNLKIRPLLRSSLSARYVGRLPDENTLSDAHNGFFTELRFPYRLPCFLIANGQKGLPKRSVRIKTCTLGHAPKRFSCPCEFSAAQACSMWRGRCLKASVMKRGSGLFNDCHLERLCGYQQISVIKCRTLSGDYHPAAPHAIFSHGGSFPIHVADSGSQSEMVVHSQFMLQIQDRKEFSVYAHADCSHSLPPVFYFNITGHDELQLQTPPQMSHDTAYVIYTSIQLRLALCQVKHRKTATGVTFLEKKIAIVPL
ncbi:hypothetical protein R6Q59_009853 [Mikania micrantha]